MIAMKELKLENTAMALKKLDKAELDFNKESDELLKSDLSGKEVNERFLQMLKELEQMKSFVRFAFFQDTKDRNCLDNCMIVSISWLREMVCKYNGEKLEKELDAIGSVQDDRDEINEIRRNLNHVPGHPSNCNCAYCNLPNKGKV
jgi:hypothetical protein